MRYFFLLHFKSLIYFKGSSKIKQSTKTIPYRTILKKEKGQDPQREITKIFLLLIGHRSK